MFTWFNLVSYVVVIPALIAVIRFNKIDKVFKPLAYNLWIGVGSEITAHFFSVRYKNNLYVYNVFMLLDFLTFLWLFNNWGAFSKISKPVKISVVSFYLALWLYDNLIRHTLKDNNFIFHIVYAMAILLVAIGQLNNVIIRNNGHLKFNPYMYICVGVMFYYAYSVFICLFNSPLFLPSETLWKWNLLIYVVVNILTNLLFAISLLWMQKKAKYI